MLSFSGRLSLYHTILSEKFFENMVGKGENGGNKHFLVFSQSFLLFTQQISNFQSPLFLAFAHAFNLDHSKPFNSLPHNKILDWSKLKAFADDKLNATEKLKFVLGRVENIVGKGENAGYQHFLLFPQCFQKPSLSGSLKVGIVW